MAISPAQAITVGVGVVGAVASGIATKKLIDNVYEKHPAGSGGDGKSALIGGGMVALGAIGGGAAMLKASTSQVARIGASLGFGAAVGALGASLLASHQHGVGIDTKTNDLMRGYDRNWDDKLDLNGSWWRMPEDTRVNVTTYKDANGDTQTTTTFRSIAALADSADANHDRFATRDELRTRIASFDADGNGRLQGEELSHYDNQYGERGITVSSGQWGY